MKIPLKLTLCSMAAICLTGTAAAQQLAFNDFELVEGSNLQSGSSYRFYNVTSGVDAVISVDSLSNATLLQIDDSPIASSTNDAAWRPTVSGLTAAGANELHYIDFSVQFYANGGNAIATLDDVTMSIFDTDGDGDYADSNYGGDGDVIEFAQVSGFTSLLSAGNHLTVLDYEDGSKLVTAMDSTTNPGMTDAAPWLSVWNFENKNSFSVRLGWYGTDYIASADNDRRYGVYFNGETTPEMVTGVAPEMIPEPSSSLMTLIAVLPLLVRRKR